RRVRCVAEGAEGARGISRVVLGVEQPEGVLDELRSVVDRATPVRLPGPGHPAEHADAVVSDHLTGQGLLAWLDLGTADDSEHRNTSSRGRGHFGTMIDAVVVSIGDLTYFGASHFDASSA